jgi:hypothetical protein
LAIFSIQVSAVERRKCQVGHSIFRLLVWLTAQLDQNDVDVVNGIALDEPPPAVVDRMEREVDVKRRIVEVCEPRLVDVTRPGGPPETMPGPASMFGEPVLRLLALVYADWPGYQEDRRIRSPTTQCPHDLDDGVYGGWHRQ